VEHNVPTIFLTGELAKRLHKVDSIVGRSLSNVHEEHLGHCFDYLREAIMRAGDTSLEKAQTAGAASDGSAIGNVDGWGVTRVMTGILCGSLQRDTGIRMHHKFCKLFKLLQAEYQFLLLSKSEVR
jgi:hypothetical protein